jgi:hypothetical protein
MREVNHKRNSNLKTDTEHHLRPQGVYSNQQRIFLNQRVRPRLHNEVLFHPHNNVQRECVMAWAGIVLSVNLVVILQAERFVIFHAYQ